MKHLLIRRSKDNEVIAIVQISDRTDIVTWTLYITGDLNQFDHSVKFISAAEYGTYEVFGFPVFAYIFDEGLLRVYDPENFTHNGPHVIRKTESLNPLKRALRVP